MICNPLRVLLARARARSHRGSHGLAAGSLAATRPASSSQPSIPCSRRCESSERSASRCPADDGGAGNICAQQHGARARRRAAGRQPAEHQRNVPSCGWPPPPRRTRRLETAKQTSVRATDCMGRIRADITAMSEATQAIKASSQEVTRSSRSSMALPSSPAPAGASTQPSSRRSL